MHLPTTERRRKRAGTDRQDRSSAEKHSATPQTRLVTHNSLSPAQGEACEGATGSSHALNETQQLPAATEPRR